MKENNTSPVRGMFERMTTKQLDELLDQELHAAPVNDSAIRLIIDILKQREKDLQVEVPAEMVQTWEKFQTQRAKPKILQMPTWILRAASVLLVIGVLFMVTPHEAQAETFFERLARLTADIVEFFSPNDNSGRFEDYEFKTDNPGLQQVYNAVVEMGVTEPVVPMWLGDECELTELVLTESPRKNGLVANFETEQGGVVYKLDVFSEEMAHQYYKDEALMNTVELHGIKHSIIQNDKKWIVIWLNDKCECSIAIDCHEDIIFRILNSIYMMEDK